MEKHTINDPLLIQWDGSGYNVNKPGIDYEELVSKSIAEELVEALIAISEELPKPSLAVTKIIKEIADNAIKKATQ